MGRSCLWFMICFTVLHLVDCHSTVRFLPGFEGPLPFELETGYVGIDESDNIKLFYYFIESEGNPGEDPLMIWLSGGPGCTSLSGLAFEIGPITFKVEEYDGRVPTLVPTPFSWTKVASIIFLDSPAGAGFSYSRNKQGTQGSDRKQAYQVDQFLRKWLIDHPEFLTNQFYVGGDSYSGMVVPAIVQHISQGNEEGVKPFINLQGYVLGNPTTDVRFDSNSKIPYAHGMGLISDELFWSLQRSCEGNYINVDPINSRCLKDLETYKKCISRINEARIQDPLCNFASPKPFLSESSQRRYLRELPSPHCYTYRYVLSSHWANNESVREALRVDEGSIGEWIRCNFGLPYKNDIQSSIPYHVSNSIKGYRSLVYSGDHDMTVPFLGTQAWIRFLNYSIVDDWRPWMINGQVAGYTRAYANRMTFATIKGGGHTAEYTPKEGFVMFQRWISGEPL